MVFGFFSRKPSLAAPTTTITTSTTEQAEPQDIVQTSDAPVVGPTSSSTAFDFSPEQQQGLHTPAPSISIGPVGSAGSPPPMPPPHTPSPAPEPQVTDPKALHDLINSVPPQTLHTYCLSLLDPISFDAITGRVTQTKKKRRKSGVTPEDAAEALKNAALPLRPHPVLTPSTLNALTSFFRELVPPPQLHCVRCHNQYFELENTDYSCRIAHDDDSTIVERVGTKIIDTDEEEEEGDSDDERPRSKSPRRPRKSGLTQPTSIYETLWGCCGQVVDGDGDQGPPDGWCYEGRHTTDLKRARFRADSTPQDDKLVPCSKRKCARPPISQVSESTATPSVRSAAVRKRKRGTRPSIDYREAADEDDNDEAEKKHDDARADDDKSVDSSAKRRKKDSTPTRGRGRPRGSGMGTSRKRVVKSKEEVDEKDDDDSMQIDEPQPGPSDLPTSANSPPASPKPKPDSLEPTTPATASKPKRPRGRPVKNTKPAKPSPLGVQREDTLPADELVPSTSSATPRTGSQVFVQLTARRPATSPSRGPRGVLTRADIITLKAKGSVTSLRDKFEGSQGEGKKTASSSNAKHKQKPLDLEEIVDSSVANEIEMAM